MDKKPTSGEKGTTKELDLSEVKQLLAKEEADIKRKKTLNQLDKDNKKEVEYLNKQQQQSYPLNLQT